MNDAQKRAQAFNAEERIAELEHIVESNTVGTRVLRAYAKKHLHADRSGSPSSRPR
jgi:hypothetical protein